MLTSRYGLRAAIAHHDARIMTIQAPPTARPLLTSGAAQHLSTLHLAVQLLRAAQRRGWTVEAMRAAIRLADEAHGGQYRTSDGSPYLQHPLLVALLVEAWAGGVDDVLAAVLHDAAEDAAVGPTFMLAAIEAQFGASVTLRVEALTKNATLHTSRERLLDQHCRLLAATRTVGTGLAAVKLADRAHNSATSAHLDPHRLARLLDENLEFYAPLARHHGARGLARFLSDRPGTWATVGDRPFAATMLAIQPAWLPAAVAQQSHA